MTHFGRNILPLQYMTENGTIVAPLTGALPDGSPAFPYVPIGVRGANMTTILPLTDLMQGPSDPAPAPAAYIFYNPTAFPPTSHSLISAPENRINNNRFYGINSARNTNTVGFMPGSNVFQLPIHSMSHNSFMSAGEHAPPQVFLGQTNSLTSNRSNCFNSNNCENSDQKLHSTCEISNKHPSPILPITSQTQKRDHVQYTKDRTQAHDNRISKSTVGVDIITKELVNDNPLKSFDAENPIKSSPDKTVEIHKASFVPRLFQSYEDDWDSEVSGQEHISKQAVFFRHRCDDEMSNSDVQAEVINTCSSLILSNNTVNFGTRNILSDLERDWNDEIIAGSDMVDSAEELQPSFNPQGVRHTYLRRQPKCEVERQSKSASLKHEQINDPPSMTVQNGQTSITIIPLGGSKMVNGENFFSHSNFNEQKLFNDDDVCDNKLNVTWLKTEKIVSSGSDIKNNLLQDKKNSSMRITGNTASSLETAFNSFFESHVSVPQRKACTKVPKIVPARTVKMCNTEHSSNSTNISPSQIVQFSNTEMERKLSRSFVSELVDSTESMVQLRTSRISAQDSEFCRARSAGSSSVVNVSHCPEVGRDEASLLEAINCGKVSRIGSFVCSSPSEELIVDDVPQIVSTASATHMGYNEQSSLANTLACSAGNQIHGEILQQTQNFHIGSINEAPATTVLPVHVPMNLMNCKTSNHYPAYPYPDSSAKVLISPKRCQSLGEGQEGMSDHLIQKPEYHNKYYLFPTHSSSEERIFSPVNTLKNNANNNFNNQLPKATEDLSLMADNSQTPSHICKGSECVVRYPEPIADKWQSVSDQSNKHSTFPDVRTENFTTSSKTALLTLFSQQNTNPTPLTVSQQLSSPKTGWTATDFPVTLPTPGQLIQEVAQLPSKSHGHCFMTLDNKISGSPTVRHSVPSPINSFSTARSSSICNNFQNSSTDHVFQSPPHVLNTDDTSIIQDQQPVINISLNSGTVFFTDPILNPNEISGTANASSDQLLSDHVANLALLSKVAYETEVRTQNNENDISSRVSVTDNLISLRNEATEDFSVESNVELIDMETSSPSANETFDEQENDREISTCDEQNVPNESIHFEACLPNDQSLDSEQQKNRSETVNNFLHNNSLETVFSRTISSESQFAPLYFRNLVNQVEGVSHHIPMNNVASFIITQDTPMVIEDTRSFSTSTEEIGADKSSASVEKVCLEAPANCVVQQFLSSDQEKTANIQQVSENVFENIVNIKNLKTSRLEFRSAFEDNVPANNENELTTIAKKASKRRKRSKHSSNRKRKPELDLSFINIEEIDDDNFPLRCGKCESDDTFSTLVEFFYHAAKAHNGMARPTGCSQEFTALEARIAQKATIHAGYSLVCHNCKRSLTSQLGFENHVKWCALTEEQRFTKCPNCAKLCTMFTMKPHLRECPGVVDANVNDGLPLHMRIFPRPLRSKFTNILQSVLESESQACDNIIADLGTANAEFIQENLLKLCTRTKSFSVSHEQRNTWLDELEIDNEATCPFANCNFVHTSLNEMEEHFLSCDKAVGNRFDCNLCQLVKDYSAEKIARHVTKKHWDDDQVQNSFQLKPHDKETKVNRKTVVPDPLKITRRYREKNFSQQLFSDWKVNLAEWTKADSSTYSAYLNKSPYFTFSIEDSWQSLEAFQSRNNKDCALLYSGGIISASAWCPLPDNTSTECDQYIAVASISHLRSAMTAYQPSDEREIISIWNCSRLSDNLKADRNIPRLEFGIAHEYGFVLDLRWCPSGIFEPLDQHKSATNTSRLGVLAAACSNGDVNMWVIPQLRTMDATNDIKMFAKHPDIVLKQDHFDEGTNDHYPTAIDWLPFKGHCRIVAAMSNGTACIWDFSTSTQYLDERSYIYYPTRILECHHGAATGVAFFPGTGGDVLSTGGVDRMQHYWDISSGYCKRVSSFRREVITNVKWPLCSTSTVVACDPTNTGESSAFIAECGFTGTNVKNCRSKASTWTISLSDPLGAIGLATDSGECIILYYLDMSRIQSDKFIKCRLSYKAGIKSLYSDHFEPLNHFQTFEEAQRACGIVFDETPEMNMLTRRKQTSCKSVINSSSLKDESKCENSVQQQLLRYPLMSVTSVAMNNNIGAHNWVFIGYRCGLARIICLPNFNVPV